MPSTYFNPSWIETDTTTTTSSNTYNTIYPWRSFIVDEMVECAQEEVPLLYTTEPSPPPPPLSDLDLNEMIERIYSLSRELEITTPKGNRKPEL